MCVAKILFGACRSDAKGKVTMEPCGQGIIPLSKLETQDAFLVDMGCELFVWIGKKASAAEKAQGMALAQRYIQVIGCWHYFVLAYFVLWC